MFWILSLTNCLPPFYLFPLLVILHFLSNGDWFFVSPRLMFFCDCFYISDQTAMSTRFFEFVVIVDVFGTQWCNLFNVLGWTIYTCLLFRFCWCIGVLHVIVLFLDRVTSQGIWLCASNSTTLTKHHKKQLNNAQSKGNITHMYSQHW